MNKTKIDKYQQRYTSHQLHKKEQLTSTYGIERSTIAPDAKTAYLELLKNRRSQRLFNSEPVSEDDLNYILSCLVESPSSCNRQAISIRVIDDRTSKELLGGLLVGGAGWCHRASKILLLFADESAYKEKMIQMPFLDAGVKIMNSYLACESIGLGCCYINPNIREENEEYFKIKFGSLTYCGAIAIGNYDKKSKYSTKISIQEMLL